MRTLEVERACLEYYNAVLLLTNWVHTLADRLISSEEMTSDSMMYWSFTGKLPPIRRILDSEELSEAFVRFYPNHAHLLDAGRELCESFERLHTVRRELLEEHLNEDRTDVCCHAADFEKSAEMTDAEHAASHGLTLDQYKTWFDQCNHTGHVYLSMSERRRLREAILSEFSDL